MSAPGVIKVPEAQLSEQARAEIQRAVPSATSALKSQTLGEAAMVVIVGFIATVFNVSAAVRGKADWVNYVVLVVGLGILWVGVGMVRQRKGSEVGEFELSFPAFYVRSYGLGEVELFRWGLCHDVSFTEVKLKGVLYNHTVMKCHFEGGGTLDFTEVVEAPHRDNPASWPSFAARLQVIERARVALGQGTYASLAGAELFPFAVP